MGRILKLPAHIADQIAAGEVVERPASVARELLENAIDAEATSITVEIADGGKRLVRVRDNGCGMDREDLELAVERHATSKIRSEDDLAAIRTLGFRGEALPSIASVSRFTLTSRVTGEDSGWRVMVDFGREKRVEPVGCPVGTCVEVEDLFLKIPARLRFLKRKQTEVGHISQQVRLYSVSAPEIRFALQSDGREVFRTSGDCSFPQALWPLLGETLVEKLLPVEGEGAGVKIKGFVAPPDEGRSSSRAFYFFLNGRNIGNRLLWKALNEAARGIFTVRTYPAGVLFLEVSPADVDVNVHPAKQEVRFHHTDAVYRAVYHSVKRAWDNRPPVSQVSWEAAGDSGAGDRGGTTVSGNVPLPWEIREGPVSGSGAGQSCEAGAESSSHISSSDARRLYKENSDISTAPVEAASDTQSGTVERGEAGDLQLIGQLAGSYIIAQGPEGLVIVDQHAAHEGLIFRRLMRQFMERGTVASQPLLFPEVVEVRPEDAERLPQIISTLGKLGIEAVQFGPAQLSVKAMPDFLAGDRNATKLLREILDRLFDAPAQDASTLMHELLASMACHSAVRANHHLEHSEMQALLVQLHEEGVKNCPHGRPVSQIISFSQIKRNFRRT